MTQQSEFVTRLITQPALEPLTLADAKGQVHVDGDDEDALLDACIRSAREQCERHVWRALITQTWECYLEGWPTCGYIVVPYAPLQSVTSITYRDADGVTATLSASSYRAETAYEPGRIVLRHNVSWPTTTLDTGLPITVRYVCGYGSMAANVPESLRHGMRMFVGHLFANREAVVVSGFQAVQVPMTVDWLWQPYKVYW